MLAAPHRAIQAADERERFSLDLLDDLWIRYRSRVSYVQTYERVVQEAGASFVNDHIAFRTFACQDPSAGIHSISRIFEALGWLPAAWYSFPDKKLFSTHFQHLNPRFPKIFISELKTWELSDSSRTIATKYLARQHIPLSNEILADLDSISKATGSRRAKLLKYLFHFFSDLPWKRMPQKTDVLALEKESQFAAWVLVHGYDVNHFTASVNSHGAPALDNIDKTVHALRQAGVPMKAEIEGEPGSKLRQSATEAIVIPVSVRENYETVKIPWTYAYFEIAERGEIVDPATGRRGRFEGFLGPQATQLFEMTKLRRQ